MANFKVGDEVICIDAIFDVFNKNWPQCVNHPAYKVLAGEKYTVGLLNGSCVGLRELAVSPSSGGCSRCGATPSADRFTHFPTWRFIKLDGLQQETETGTEKALAENV